MLVRGQPARLHYSVQGAGVRRLEITGDPGGLGYQFTRAGRQAATVAPQWLTWAPAFGLGVRVAEGEDPLMILAVTAMIESAWARL